MDGGGYKGYPGGSCKSIVCRELFSRNPVEQNVVGVFIVMQYDLK